jgi:hypothetical protein
MTRLGDRLEAALTNTHEHDGKPLPAPLFFAGVLDASPMAAATLLALAAATPLWCRALGASSPAVDAARWVKEVVATRSRRIRGAPR